MKTDFQVYADGPMSTVYLLIPLSDAARAWVDEHLPEDRLTLGAGVAVEHRYIGDLVETIIGDGLTVS